MTIFQRTNIRGAKTQRFNICKLYQVAFNHAILNIFILILIFLKKLYFSIMPIDVQYNFWNGSELKLYN